MDLPILTGWVPVAIEALSATILAVAVGWRSPAWRQRSLPVAVGAGGLIVAVVFAYVSSQSWADEPAPGTLWLWLGLTSVATVVAVVGWRSAPWWRRALSLLAIPLSVLCVLLSVNIWVGYFQTAQSTWDYLTRRPMPNQIDLATAYSMAARGDVPTHGRIVSIDTGSAASHFEHRAEIVYLPPAWFASSPPPPLPVVMMINGEFGFSTDWIRAGNAVRTADKYAASHSGQAPVMVFVDKGGVILRDTECVNGPRGNVADHLTKDVVDFMVSHFGVSADAAHWGVAGYSVGGTCAVDLAVMHPELFGSFLDVAGDWGPNLGNKQETIDQLYGGDVAAWRMFDPPTVMARHGPYVPGQLSGLFIVPNATSPPDTLSPLPSGLDVNQDPSTKAANSLCRAGLAIEVDCAVVTHPGRHDWPFAAQVFRLAFPWFASRLGTPGIPSTPMPTGPPLGPPGG